MNSLCSILLPLFNKFGFEIRETLHEDRVSDSKLIIYSDVTHIGFMGRQGHKCDKKFATSVEAYGVGDLLVELCCTIVESFD